jgi:hypothetical protein
MCRKRGLPTCGRRSHGTAVWVCIARPSLSPCLCVRKSRSSAMIRPAISFLSFPCVCSYSRCRGRALSVRCSARKSLSGRREGWAEYRRRWLWSTRDDSQVRRLDGMKPYTLRAVVNWYQLRRRASERLRAAAGRWLLPRPSQHTSQSHLIHSCQSSPNALLIALPMLASWVLHVGGDRGVASAVPPAQRKDECVRGDRVPPLTSHLPAVPTAFRF